MARPIVPAGIEVVVQARQLGTLRINVLHLSANSPTPSAAELLSAATVVMQQYDTHLQNYTTDVTFEKVTATDISQLSGQSAVVAFPANAVGTSGGSPATSSISAVVSINSTHGGRSGHGRIYMFGLSLSHLVAGDFLLPAYMQSVLDQFNALNAATTAAGLPAVVFSRKNLALYPWQGLTMDGNVDSQRRRLVGRGR